MKLMGIAYIMGLWRFTRIQIAETWEKHTTMFLLFETLGVKNLHCKI